jgi:uncharacterized protein
VVIEGPKACGKTMTASQQALAVEPALDLEGAKPRLLDEWQLAPELWNQVRRAVDGSDQPGQFLLTGSALPPDDANRHTGAGRFGFLRVRPMSLVETGVSGGALSLRHLFAGELQATADSSLTVQDLCALIARGGWPAQQGRSLLSATRAARGYREQVRQVDISRVGDRRFDPAIRQYWPPLKWCDSPGTPIPATPGYPAHLKQSPPLLALQGVGMSIL